VKDLSMVKLELSLPGNMAFLEIALSYITQCARVYGFSKKEIDQIRLASEEAVTNIIQHALFNNPGDNFRILCLSKKNQFEIIFQEKGLPFELEAQANYDPSNVQLDDNTNGLGLFLMKKMMDEVHFKNLGRKGKETHLIKYLLSGRIDRITSLKKNEIIPLADKNMQFHIRKFKDDDAINISKCAHAAYGYSYESFIYYPDKIKQMNQEGKMISLVMENDEGDLAGHIALKYYNNPCVAEVGVGFISPKFRGLNLLQKMIQANIGAALEGKEPACLYGRAVTAHCLSQKGLTAKNFLATGCMLLLFPSDVEFKDLGGHVSQKDSALVMCRNLEKDKIIKTIYLPEKHMGMVSEIFNRLNLPVAPGVPKEPGPGAAPGGAILSYQMVDVMNATDIYCHIYSNETVREIKRLLSKLCIDGVEVIYLYLDLEEVSIPFIAEECEKMGFFFSTILPFGIDRKHALIYQYINNRLVNFENIHVEDVFSKNVLGYVKDCYNSTIER